MKKKKGQADQFIDDKIEQNVGKEGPAKNKGKNKSKNKNY